MILQKNKDKIIGAEHEKEQIVAKIDALQQKALSKVDSTSSDYKKMLVLFSRD